ncbi:uroporphyrinogen-III synthase [Listeria cossartiae subsp. cayugensis]|uniref:uroporphyrinogen-III synthase n=1 Tax=Listeria cossartiae TaxID=2838249 RepID=UPI002880B77A|nr:uroporphyrinogen-III synthase [Listeria cossartiae]MDS9999972.1 uroporphyrinogen-III synthase [Listeria cossartiae subsp. cayugensis]MDT0007581.1 uroporphyrinogen-III synthase [Listeria cossartiae subsp. cayugensis]MDT0030004.1 uroporphyrinogen-III synthase [Listeria cossartiae subsp. cayugensis]MDT0038119.1 uroporphyrinogen-III synthase [Listeria cossartiae subsp. cayugensis]MDT0043469.1 uroporphyrinogen-III synthase [Listeria cossartiae subsp. cayugensis]
MIKKIVLTREASKNKPWQAYFSKNGFEVESIPLIETRPKKFSLNQEQQAADWLFLTSVNAVEYFFANQHVKTNYKFAVIGEKTEEKLAEFGYMPNFVPSVYQSEVFLSEWLNENPDQTSVLLPQSNLSRSIIKDALIEKGHLVFSMELYETSFPEASKTRLINQLKLKEKQIIIFASPSAWKNFYSIAKTFPDQKEYWRIASIGNVTTEAILADGWSVTYQPQTFTMKHLADLIIQEEFK